MRLERFGKDDQALYEALVFNEEAMRKTTAGRLQKRKRNCCFR